MNPPALIFGGRRWAAEEAHAAVLRRQEELMLRSSGRTSRPVIAFPSASNPDTVWSFFAAMALDAVALPVPDGATTMDESYRAASEAPFDDATRLRLLTSGSTGTPKIVDLSAQQLRASADASRARIGCEPHDIWLCCLPLNHIAGLSILMRAGIAGATVHLQRRFDADSVNHAIDDDEITMISLVPTMLRRLLDDRADRPFPASLRVILLGGAPAHEDLLDRCRQIHAPVALTWGMSETASQIATRVPGDLRSAPDVGLPLPGHRVFVQDGYLGVEGPVAPNGRLLTADRGHLDDEGRVVVDGRGDAVIISGGENVDPSRVRDVLRTHPSVTDAVVLGMPDVEWGERVCAVLTGHREGHLQTWLRTRLAPHERPRQIFWVDSLPRNAMGKVQLTVLRTLLSAD